MPAPTRATLATRVPAIRTGCGARAGSRVPLYIRRSRASRARSQGIPSRERSQGHLQLRRVGNCISVVDCKAFQIMIARSSPTLQQWRGKSGRARKKRANPCSASERAEGWGAVWAKSRYFAQYYSALAKWILSPTGT